MASSVVPERLDVVVLWRLAATPRPSLPRLREALRRWLPDAGDELFEASLARLAERGHVSSDAVTPEGTRAAREQAGGEARWQFVAGASLPMHALGWRADDARARAKIKEGWAAAVVARHYGLIDAKAAPPTTTAVADAIVWRRLGLDGKPPRGIPAAVRKRLLATVLESDGANWERELALLAARAALVPRADLVALRDGVVKTWLGGRNWTQAREAIDVLAGLGREERRVTVTAPSPPAPASVEDLDSFARRVRAAAASARTGLFGDRKVFISALFRELGDAAGVPTLDAFKKLLVEANRQGLLHLHRADLVQEMDPAEVSASATQHLDATFHFVEREEAP
jgi:hypothetical protein